MIVLNGHSGLGGYANEAYHSVLRSQAVARERLASAGLEQIYCSRTLSTNPKPEIDLLPRSTDQLAIA